MCFDFAQQPGDEGDKADKGEKESMPNAQCPMPNAQLLKRTAIAVKFLFVFRALKH